MVLQSFVTKDYFENEYMKDHLLSCRVRYGDMIDHRSYTQLGTGDEIDHRKWSLETEMRGLPPATVTVTCSHHEKAFSTYSIQ